MIHFNARMCNKEYYYYYYYQHDLGMEKKLTAPVHTKVQMTFIFQEAPMCKSYFLKRYSNITLNKLPLVFFVKTAGVC